MPDCSESTLFQVATALARDLGPRDRVLLEGPMGVGKTTFAKALIAGLGVMQPPEGSPTFAIAHEYHSPRGAVIHLDLYRLRSEAEIDEAGIPAYFWERDAIVISEWLSQWPKLEDLIKGCGRCWLVKLEFVTEISRKIEIEKIG